MRAAGGYPNHPIPQSAARVRLQQLELRLKRLEDALAQGPTLELWAERDGWAEEHAALRDALNLLESMPTLPRCGCGKVVHETPEQAERHVRLLKLVNDRRSAVPLVVYDNCPVRRHPGWHVGHARTP